MDARDARPQQRAGDDARRLESQQLHCGSPQSSELGNEVGDATSDAGKLPDRDGAGKERLAIRGVDQSFRSASMGSRREARKAG